MNSGNNAYCLGQKKSELHNAPKNTRNAIAKRNSFASTAGEKNINSAGNHASAASNDAAGKNDNANGNNRGLCMNLPLPKSAR